jgi:hypothetical protein
MFNNNHDCKAPGSWRQFSLCACWQCNKHPTVIVSSLGCSLMGVKNPRGLHKDPGRKRNKQHRLSLWFMYDGRVKKNHCNHAFYVYCLKQVSS